MTCEASEILDAPVPNDFVRLRPSLLPFAGLYVAFGATFGLIGSAAPLVLRARGTTLAEVGLLQLIYLPMTVSFLWAPLVDRLRLPFLSRRIAYIVAAQVVTVGLLLAFAWLTEGSASISLGGLFALAVGVSAAAATMDVALEALVVDTVARERRSPVTTAKLCGSALGSMLGIGLATSFPSTVGLRGAFLAVAAINLAVVAPILFYGEPERNDVARPSTRVTMAGLRTVLGRGLALGLYFAAGVFVGENPGLVLLDLHVPLATAGLMTGTVIPAVGLVMTLVSGALAARVVAHRLVGALAIGVAAGAVLFSLAAVIGSPSLAVVAAALVAGFLSLLGVPVFNLVYRWAEGPAAATNYALLFGIACLVAMPARVGAPALAGAVGWATYFAMSVPICAASVWWLVRAMRKSAPRVPA